MKSQFKVCYLESPGNECGSCVGAFLHPGVFIKCIGTSELLRKPDEMPGGGEVTCNGLAFHPGGVI